MRTASFRAGWTLGLAALCLLAFLRSATAVPSFAAQTGEPCVACHIGAFGPQLTPFGRAFKIGGYTQTGGEGLAAKIPLAAMVLTSFTNTREAQPEPPASGFARNNNFALDQISIFLAGRVTDNLGGFVQGTYSGTDRAFQFDNTDIRLTAPFDLKDSELRLGISLNTGPTVEDPYNSTYAWIFPFASSALAPTPAAQPLIAGGLLGNSIGATLYAWYDRRLYLEAGLYNTYGPTLLSATGTTYGPGATASPAPYARAAYEWNWNGQSAHVGALFLHSDINPSTGDQTATGAFGRNSYTDYAIDGGYQFLGDNTNVVTADAILAHEDAVLHGSTALGNSSQKSSPLNQVRLSLSYFYEETYGINFGWQDTWGKANPLLYPPAPVTGSANGKPNSNAFIIEADWIPWGKAGSWGAPFANLKIGLQYTIYTSFNGGTRDYDGFGRNASDNNTLFLYAWTEF